MDGFVPEEQREAVTFIKLGCRAEGLAEKIAGYLEHMGRPEGVNYKDGGEALRRAAAAADPDDAGTEHPRARAPSEQVPGPAEE